MRVFVAPAKPLFIITIQWIKIHLYERLLCAHLMPFFRCCCLSREQKFGNFINLHAKRMLRFGTNCDMEFMMCELSFFSFTTAVRVKRAPQPEKLVACK